MTENDEKNHTDLKLNTEKNYLLSFYAQLMESTSSVAMQNICLKRTEEIKKDQTNKWNEENKLTLQKFKEQYLKMYDQELSIVLNTQSETFTERKNSKPRVNKYLKVIFKNLNLDQRISEEYLKGVLEWRVDELNKEVYWRKSKLEDRIKIFEQALQTFLSKSKFSINLEGEIKESFPKDLEEAFVNELRRQNCKKIFHEMFIKIDENEENKSLDGIVSEALGEIKDIELSKKELKESFQDSILSDFVYPERCDLNDIFEMC